MVGRTLSAAATQSLTAETTGEVWLYLITINHADLPAPIRLVSNVEDIVSNGETYVGLPFAIELPDEGERAGEARIRVDNVRREITEWVRSMTGPPTVDIQVILADSPDTIELEISGLTMRDVTYDAVAVTGYLRAEDLTVEPVAEIITPARFPGLFSIGFALLALAHSGFQFA